MLNTNLTFLRICYLRTFQLHESAKQNHCATSTTPFGSSTYHLLLVLSQKLYEPRHKISNNVVCATDQPAHTRILMSLDYPMIVKLLTEHHLEVVSLKGDYTGSSESTLVKIPHCWKSHVAAHVCTAIQWC